MVENPLTDFSTTSPASLRSDSLEIRVQANHLCFDWRTRYKTLVGWRKISRPYSIVIDSSKTCPLKWPGNIKIYRRSSNYIQMDTNFGLDILFKVTEVFQVYITVGVMFYGDTSGLCGNFNGDSTDDFKSSMNIIEGNPSIFVSSWRVTANCGPAHNEDSDPCSLSQVNEMFAEAHCSVLLQESSIFGQCHKVLDPLEFYKNCRFEICNYEQTNDFMCASLVSYVRACAKRGVFLIEWRNTIDRCTLNTSEGDSTLGDCSQEHDHGMWDK
ncbi:mucin-6-like [Heterodontus francisci]|uniref:mucin-6-like n=1 Tax=Heterodontus francisci TaxID=7792 RepID=UPI00355B440E